MAYIFMADINGGETIRSLQVGHPGIAEVDMA